MATCSRRYVQATRRLRGGLFVPLTFSQRIHCTVAVSLPLLTNSKQLGCASIVIWAYSETRSDGIDRMGSTTLCCFWLRAVIFYRSSSG